MKRPRLVVKATLRYNFPIPECLTDFGNFVGITVESVYNLPDQVTEGMNFDAIFSLPYFGDVSLSVFF